MGSTIYGFKVLMTNGINNMIGQNRHELKSLSVSDKAKGAIRYE
jgi:hypothetical protein